MVRGLFSLEPGIRGSPRPSYLPATDEVRKAPPTLPSSKQSARGPLKSWTTPGRPLPTCCARRPMSAASPHALALRTRDSTLLVFNWDLDYHRVAILDRDMVALSRCLPVAVYPSPTGIRHSEMLGLICHHRFLRLLQHQPGFASLPTGIPTEAPRPFGVPGVCPSCRVPLSSNLPSRPHASPWQRTISFDKYGQSSHGNVS